MTTIQTVPDFGLAVSTRCSFEPATSADIDAVQTVFEENAELLRLLGPEQEPEKLARTLLECTDLPPDEHYSSSSFAVLEMVHDLEAEFDSARQR